jgi:hypothetical protein
MSCRTEGSILSMSELRGIINTTLYPFDEAEHKTQKESKPSTPSIITVCKPIPNWECETQSFDSVSWFQRWGVWRGSSGKCWFLLHKVWAEASVLMGEEPGDDPNCWVLELTGCLFPHMCNRNDFKIEFTWDWWPEHHASPCNVVFSCMATESRQGASQGDFLECGLPREPWSSWCPLKIYPQKLYSSISAIFYEPKQWQIHPDSREKNTDPTSWLKEQQRIWSHILKSSHIHFNFSISRVAGPHVEQICSYLLTWWSQHDSGYFVSTYEMPTGYTKKFLRNIFQGPNILQGQKEQKPKKLAYSW